MLRLFYADIWCRFGRGILRHGPSGARALATRFHGDVPSAHVVSFSLGAMLSRTVLNIKCRRTSPGALADEYCRFGRWFALRVCDHLSTIELDPERDMFFGFNTNCLETLELLKERRVFTVVDQVDPARAEEETVRTELERWPGWAQTPGPVPDGYWERLKAEWAAADLVLVNSEWSAAGLVQQGMPRAKIITVPLAIDLGPLVASEPVKPGKTLKVLWLGSVILRKGIPYLVEAARLLQGQDIEFLVAGQVGISDRAVRAFPPNMKVLGRVTRDKLGEVYRQAHVFVLPTISDGFAVTQLEAMAHGLPVVATPNCGRVVTDGADGLIVPPRDGKALANALARLHNDRPLLREMSRNALTTVRSYDLPSNAILINEQVAKHHPCWHSQATNENHHLGHQLLP
jgi:glycosyltransferase involved in cell wall biosynthesis